jgi:hypothetical protein
MGVQPWCLSAGVLRSDRVSAGWQGQVVEKLVGDLSVIDGSGAKQFMGIRRTVQDGWQTVCLESEH